MLPFILYPLFLQFFPLAPTTQEVVSWQKFILLFTSEVLLHVFTVYMVGANFILLPSDLSSSPLL